MEERQHLRSTLYKKRKGFRLKTAAELRGYHKKEQTEKLLWMREINTTKQTRDKTGRDMQGGELNCTVRGQSFYGQEWGRSAMWLWLGTSRVSRTAVKAAVWKKSWIVQLKRGNMCSVVLSGLFDIKKVILSTHSPLRSSLLLVI